MSAPRPLPATRYADLILDRWRREGVIGRPVDDDIAEGLATDDPVAKAQALAQLASARDDLADDGDLDPHWDVLAVASSVIGTCISQLRDTDGHAPATWWQRICEQADDWAAYTADGPDHEDLADLHPDVRMQEADCRANDALANLRRIVEELR